MTLPTQLDPIESAVRQTADSAPTATASADRDERRKVLDAMTQALVSPTRWLAYQNCRTSFWILRSKTEPTRYKLVADACHDRWCQDCAAAKAALVRHNLKAKIKNANHRLLTLTLKHTDTPLPRQLDHLYRDFRKLRRSGAWLDRVTGGCAFTEITLSKADGLFHLHLHVLLEGLYFPLATIRQLWLAATGDSHVIDIRLVTSTAGICNYVTKYLTKPLHPSILNNHDALATTIQAFAGRRLIVTFGTWRKWNLTRPAKETDWQYVCHAHAIDDTTKLPPNFRRFMIAALTAYDLAIPPIKGPVTFVVPDALPQPPPDAETLQRCPWLDENGTQLSAARSHYAYDAE